MSDERKWFCDGSGLINIELSLEEAQTGYHQGDCEEGVRYLLTLPHIKAQVDEWAMEALKDNLRRYGAWSEEELADEDMTICRTLWLLCGDVTETWDNEDEQ